MPRGHRSRYRATLLGIVALLVLPAPASQAGNSVYCPGQFFASGATCSGPLHSLRRNQVHNVNGYRLLVGSSALTQNWNQYGNWVNGYQNACHSYSGANLLYGWMRNQSSSSQYMTGNEFWGSESPCS